MAGGCVVVSYVVGERIQWVSSGTWSDEEYSYRGAVCTHDLVIAQVPFTYVYLVLVRKVPVSYTSICYELRDVRVSYDRQIIAHQLPLSISG